MLCRDMATLMDFKVFLLNLVTTAILIAALFRLFQEIPQVSHQFCIIFWGGKCSPQST